MGKVCYLGMTIDLVFAIKILLKSFYATIRHLHVSLYWIFLILRNVIIIGKIFILAFSNVPPIIKEIDIFIIDPSIVQIKGEVLPLGTIINFIIFYLHYLYVLVYGVQIPYSCTFICWVCWSTQILHIFVILHIVLLRLDLIEVVNPWLN